MVIIGIDPAIRKNGQTICIVDESREMRFKSFANFLAFLKWATDPLEVRKEKALVGIENSNLTEETFWTHKDSKGRLYTSWQARKIPGLTPLSKKEVAKISRNVGKNQAASLITVDVCRWIFGDGRVIEMSPKQKGRKWTDAEFRGVASQEGHKVFQYKGNANEQDKRDAYQIGLKARQMHFMKAAKVKR